MIKQKRKWDENSIKEWLKENKPEFEFIETKIVKRDRKVYLKKEDKEAWVIWTSVLDGKNIQFRNIYTTETFKEKLKNKFPHIELLEEYKGDKIEHKFYCNECESEFIKSPCSLFANTYGCNTCYFRLFENGLEDRRNNFKIRFENKYKNEYEILSEYNNLEDKMTFKHNICNRTFEANATTILRGVGCPYCNIEKQRKTHEEFKEQLETLYPGKYELLSEYVRREDKVRVKYLCCNTEKETNPADLIKGLGCGVCSGSSLEQIMKSVLENYNVKFIFQHTIEGCRYIKLLRFDFYLPEYNAVIETMGEQHYYKIDFYGGEEGLKLTQLRDKIKKDFCLNNNIIFIEIPYYNCNIPTITNILKEHDII